MKFSEVAKGGWFVDFSSIGSLLCQKVKEDVSLTDNGLPRTHIHEKTVYVPQKLETIKIGVKFRVVGEDRISFIYEKLAHNIVVDPAGMEVLPTFFQDKICFEV